MDRSLSEIIYPELLRTQKLKSCAFLDNSYMLWKLKLTFVLKDHKVHHVLETSKPNEDDPEWEKAEALAMFLIMMRLEDQFYSELKKHSTAKAFLDHLEATHNGKIMFQTHLCGLYAGYVMDKDVNINEHIFWMRAKAKVIGFQGVEIPEEVQALALLNSLHDDWEDDVEKVMLELHASSSTDALSFDNVGKRLRAANDFRQWRRYRNFESGGGSKKVKGKTSNLNDHDGPCSFNPSFSLTEMIYPRLKTSGQLNHTGSDFHFWKKQIHSVLGDNGVAYLLHDSPSELDASSRSKRSSDEFVARHIILGGMSDDLFLTFHDYPTARALMDALGSWFGSPSIAQQMVEFRKYTRCEMPENRPIDKHLLEMDTLVANLKLAGVEIPDEMQAELLIDSLPESWSYTQTGLRTNIDRIKDPGDEKLKLADRVRRRIRSADSIKKSFKTTKRGF